MEDKKIPSEEILIAYAKQNPTKFKAKFGHLFKFTQEFNSEDGSSKIKLIPVEKPVEEVKEVEEVKKVEKKDEGAEIKTEVKGGETLKAKKK